MLSFPEGWLCCLPLSAYCLFKHRGDSFIFSMSQLLLPNLFVLGKLALKEALPLMSTWPDFTLSKNKPLSFDRLKYCGTFTGQAVCNLSFIWVTAFENKSLPSKDSHIHEAVWCTQTDVWVEAGLSGPGGVRLRLASWSTRHSRENHSLWS